MFFARGAGGEAFDEDGNRYVDFCMSWGPLALGHAHPAVVQAVQETAAKGTSFGTPTREEAGLAEAYRRIEAGGWGRPSPRSPTSNGRRR